jgi:hypothetical protein
MHSVHYYLFHPPGYIGMLIFCAPILAFISPAESAQGILTGIHVYDHFCNLRQGIQHQIFYLFGLRVRFEQAETPGYNQVKVHMNLITVMTCPEMMNVNPIRASMSIENIDNFDKHFRVCFIN